MQHPTRSIEERLWARVDRSGDCWLWTGARRNGYGHMSIPPNTQAYTHRVSWQLHFGPIPPGLEVCHKCDVKLCVRPDHLFLGTRADNARDMAQKGRSGFARHPETVLRGERWHAAHPQPDHCIHGHPKTPENLDARGKCLPCKRRINREYMRRRDGYYLRRNA